MSDEQQPGMSEEFKARMRQGLSSMAVRERVRERRRNRAIAGGAVAAVAAAVIGVGAWQFTGALDPRVEQAAPPAPSATVEPSTTVQPSTTPAPTNTSSATETSRPEPTPPPGFEGVAAGQPIVTASVPSTDSGDTGAAGGPGFERVYDVYVLCEGTGAVSFGGTEWIDCADFEEGTGWAVFGQVDEVGDGDPRYTASQDFDGQLSVVDAGATPPGSAGGSTATVYYDCGATVTIGGVLFDCDADPTAIVNLAAWGVPIGAGSFAPRVESDAWTASVRWVVER